MLLAAAGCATIDPAQRAAEREATRAALDAAERISSGFVGVYAARRPAASSGGRAFTLELRVSGTAELVTVYLGRGRVVELGTWEAAGDALRVEWEARPDGVPAPAPMEWLRSGAQLVPAVWDPSVWGEAGLPLTRWQASRPARAGCSWRPFADAVLGLRLLVESCATGVPGGRFAARGAEIVDVADASGGARGTPVIQVFSKRAGHAIDEAIRARFFPQLVPTVRAGCRVRRQATAGEADAAREIWRIVPTDEYREQTAKWREAEPGAMVCGPYSERAGEGYFEFRPNESATRYLFVWIGGDLPHFDEHSIELLD